MGFGARWGLGTGAKKIRNSPLIRDGQPWEMQSAMEGTTDMGGLMFSPEFAGTCLAKVENWTNALWLRIRRKD